MFDRESKLPTLSFGASMRLPLIISKWSTLDASNVLEIGCGQARLSSRLIRVSSKYMAVEPDQESFLFAKKFLGENSVSLGTSAEFNQKSSFSLIFSTEVLEHIENDREEIKHWNSILQLGGNVLITVPAHERLFGLADQRVGHYRRYSKSRIISIFEESGFEVKDITLFGGLSSLLLLLLQNLVALFERNKKSSAELNGLESGRWHQSNRETVFGQFSRNVFTKSSRYPKNFGSSFLVVATKMKEI